MNPAEPATRAATLHPAPTDRAALAALHAAALHWFSV